MDTVTESKMAPNYSEMPQEGGIGVLHKNMTLNLNH